MPKQGTTAKRPAPVRVRQSAAYKVPARNQRREPNAAVLRETKRYCDHHDVYYGGKHEIPTIDGLGTILKLPPSVVLRWREDGKTGKSKPASEFNELCELIEQKAAHVVLHDGAMKMLSSQVAMGYLQTHRNYNTKHEISGPDKGPINLRAQVDMDDPKELAKAYVGLMEGS